MRDRRTVAPRKNARARRDRSPGIHWLLLVALLLSAAFIEVWESTTASQLSLEIDRMQQQVRDDEAKLAHLKAQTAEATNRVVLAGYAEPMGLRPADPGQIVEIPGVYLETGIQQSLPNDGMVAVGRRIAEVFIPTARARDRGLLEEGGS